MNKNLRYLPAYIIKHPTKRSYFLNGRDQSLIHKSVIEKYCVYPASAEVEREKHEAIMASRYDLRQD